MRTLKDCLMTMFSFGTSSLGNRRLITSPNKALNKLKAKHGRSIRKQSTKVKEKGINTKTTDRTAIDIVYKTCTPAFALKIVVVAMGVSFKIHNRFPSKEMETDVIVHIPHDVTAIAARIAGIKEDSSGGILSSILRISL